MFSGARCYGSALDNESGSLVHRTELDLSLKDSEFVGQLSKAYCLLQMQAKVCPVYGSVLNPLDLHRVLNRPRQT